MTARALPLKQVGCDLRTFLAPIPGVIHAEARADLRHVHIELSIIRPCALQKALSKNALPNIRHRILFLPSHDLSDIFRKIPVLVKPVSAVKRANLHTHIIINGVAQGSRLIANGDDPGIEQFQEFLL